MARRIWGGLLAVVASAAGLGLAVAVGSAGASNLAAVTTTLGSTTGTPSQNICSSGFDCTYVPFSSAGAPGLRVPFDGTVTSFSVNSGSAGAPLQLRVLRPAANGQFTGAGTSATETTGGGPQTFTLASPLPVKTGDVLALDNNSSALLFENSAATSAFTAYYSSSGSTPGLPDGTTATPTNNQLLRLLLSATVVSSGTTTTGTTTNGTTVTTTVSGGTTTVVKTVSPKPVIGNPTQSRSKWSLKQGTTFALGLGVSAKLLYVFRQQVGRHKIIRGTLAAKGHPGTNRLHFKGRVAGGKKLKRGRYTVTITATNQTGVSKPVSLSFTISG